MRLNSAADSAFIAELLGFAVESLSPLGKKAEPLRELAKFVELRGH